AERLSVVGDAGAVPNQRTGGNHGFDQLLFALVAGAAIAGRAVRGFSAWLRALRANTAGCRERDAETSGDRESRVAHEISRMNDDTRRAPCHRVNVLPLLRMRRLACF